MRLKGATLEQAPGAVRFVPRVLRGCTVQFIGVCSGVVIALLAAVLWGWLAPAARHVTIWHADRSEGMPPSELRFLSPVALTSVAAVRIAQVPGRCSMLLSLKFGDPKTDAEHADAWVTVIGVPAPMIAVSSPALADRVLHGLALLSKADSSRTHALFTWRTRALWSGVVLNTLFFGLIASAILTLMDAKSTAMARHCICAVATGYCLSLLIAWSAPLLPLLNRTHWYHDPAAYSQVVEAIPQLPHASWDRFTAFDRRGFAHRQREWSYTRQAFNGITAHRVAGNSRTQLGFPFTAFKDDRTGYFRPNGMPWQYWRVFHMNASWGGLVANWLLWSLVVLATLRTPRHLKRLHRVRKGRCPACGYVVGAHPRCTECGEVVHVRH